MNVAGTPPWHRWLSISGPVILLLLWELCVRIGVLDARFFTPPSEIVIAMWEMTLSGELWQHTWASLYRIFAGFVLGSVPGVLLGILMGLVPAIRALLTPILAAFYPIPKSAILPLIMIFLGIGNTSKIVTLAIGMFFLVWINTMTGVLTIAPIYLDVGRNFGARGWQFYRTIALPGALPMIIAGLKLAFGIGLLLIIVVEMVGTDLGIGHLIWTAWQTFSMESLFVGLIVISLLGFGSSHLLDALERRIVPWKRH